jgi:tetratricopeptide (TPR) repeat protein
MIWPFKRKSKTKEVNVEFTVRSDHSSEALALYTKRYPALDRHFELTEKLRNTYTPSNERAVEKGIAICREMIKISKDVGEAWKQQNSDRARASKLNGDKDFRPWPLPNHLGFKQLAIILEKRGEYEEAIEVVKQARSQGWNGDWEKRIARCQSKIAKRQRSL